MSQTAPEDEGTVSDEVLQAQFEAGYSGTEAPTERPAEVVEAPVIVQPEYAQLTKEQVDQLLTTHGALSELRAAQEKQFGTAFGKLGGIERWKSEQDAALARVKELSSSITQEKIDALRAEFPEHATVLEIVRSMPVLPVSTPADPKLVDELVAQRVAAITQSLPELVERNFELKFLTRAHPDWQEVSASDGFKAYRSALPEAERKKLEDSWDSQFVGKHLDAYKAKKVPAANQPNPQTQRRQSRMAAAVFPRGSGQAPASDPEADFSSGFNSRGA